MTILTQSYLNSLANQTFTIVDDYSMNGNDLTFNGINLQFNGGTISNGTMTLNNCTLSGTMSHSINATVFGTLTNNTIYSSWFTRIGQMKFNYTGKTINFDENATITDDIDHVDLFNNRLVCMNSDYTNFCRLYQCKHPKIESNEIIFSACSITSGTLVCRLINFDTANLSYSVGVTASVKDNIIRNTNLQLPSNVEMSVFSNISELFNSNYYNITLVSR